jgi:hypothetical protein
VLSGWHDDDTCGYCDAAFEVFASKLNPATVEAERMTAPGPDEDFGSQKSLDDAAAHEWIVQDFYAQAREVEHIRAIRREHSTREAAAFVAAVVAARETGRPYPTVPIRLTLAAQRAQSTTGGIAA